MKSVRKWFFPFIIILVMIISTIQIVDSEEIIVKHDPTASLLSTERIVNIAHRGASAHAPEHTLKAYQYALDMHADYLEIDLQMTEDGTIIAMHDFDVSRITDRRGNVSNLSIHEVKELEVGAWFNKTYPKKAAPHFSTVEVLTLEEILVHFGASNNYYIEIKNPEEFPNIESKLVGILQKHGLLNEELEDGNVIIQSFSKESLLKVHEIAPSIPLIQLWKANEQLVLSEEQLETIKQYAVGMGVNASTLTQEEAERIRNHELLLHTYTVNDEEEMRKLLQWGVTGIFTNYPDRLAKILMEYEES